jgi:PAS domain S-box-containing protein
VIVILETSTSETLRHLELILEATDQGICVVDEHGCCTLFNRAASAMTGWRPEEVLGRSLHDLIHHTQLGGSPHSPEECPVLGVLHSGKSVHKDDDIYWRRDGTPFSVDYSSSLVREGSRTIGVVVVFTDVTERKAAEENYRATLNILEDFDDERRNVQLVQRATVNLLEDMSNERNRLEQTQKATLNILEDFDEEKAKLQQLQHALMNILEDVEVERAKADQSRVLLEAVNRELEAFSYSVSHDLRAPLRAISGFAQAVVEDYAPRLDDEGKRFLGLIQDNAHRMGQLIDDLLTFSRLGRQQLMEAQIDMGALAQAVFEELLAQHPGREIRFMVHDVPPALGDRAMIRQVLVNLLSNAIKFTRPRAEAVVEFGYSRQHGRGAYYVKDNGVGFDMQYAGKLFGVFQRLHAVTEFEGTGVGLAIVYRIITRHGGRVWAQGEVDKGAAFYFTLATGEAPWEKPHER